MSEETKALNRINAYEQYVKVERDREWNAAIEEAAKECEQWDKGASPKSDIAPEIRKLKK